MNGFKLKYQVFTEAIGFSCSFSVHIMSNADIWYSYSSNLLWRYKYTNFLLLYDVLLTYTTWQKYWLLGEYYSSIAGQHEVQQLNTVPVDYTILTV